MAHLRGADGFISVPGTSSSANGSVTQTGFDLYNLIQTALKGVAFSIDQKADTGNTTGLTSSSDPDTYMASGLKRSTLSFKGLFPKAAPAYGHRGFVTAASHYTAHLDGWTLSLAWASGETTEFQDPPSDHADYEPGDLSWKGTMVGDVSSSVSVKEVGVEAAALFRLKDETTLDTTFAGTIITDSRGMTVDKQGGLQRLSQSFVGDGPLTAAGDNKLFAGAVGLPDITELVLQYGSGKTETVLGFLTGLNIAVSRGSLTTVTGSIQLTGSPVIS